ncbi:MAG: enhanced intracellular survival protein Eis [Sandaracinaceae bacterium]
MSTIVVRPAEGESDRAALDAILRESFGHPALPWATWMERIGHENLRVATVGGEILGGLGFYRFGQYWGGRSVSLIGLAGVGVDPRARGRGIAKRFLVDTLAEARDEGVPLAGLYASSVSVYRSVGFEQTAAMIQYVAPIAALPPGDGALACEAYDPREDGATRALYVERARGWNGHLDRNPAMWERIAAPYDAVPRAYRFGDAAAPEGYVVYQELPAAGALHFRVRIRDYALATPAAARRACALLYGLRSLGEELEWFGCGADPWVSLMPEERARADKYARSMTRILDAPKALAARGYETSGEARFDLRDPLFGDVGLHVRVRDGRAEVAVEPFGRAKLTLDPRALAGLYANSMHPSTARAMGLLDGDEAAAHALARLFAGPEPWVCDWY